MLEPKKGMAFERAGDKRLHVIHAIVDQNVDGWPCKAIHMIKNVLPDNDRGQARIVHLWSMSQFRVALNTKQLRRII